MKYKQDLDRAKTYWQAFWNQEIIDRPCVFVTSPNDGKARRRTPRPFNVPASFDEHKQSLDWFDDWAASTYFGGESIPYFQVNFGPDQFSAFLGAELLLAEDQKTSWVKPFVSDWKTAKLEIRKEPESVWNKMLRHVQVATEFSRGKFLIAMLDLHSNMDCLSAVRDPANLCMDIIDCPEDVERALGEVRALYAPVYEAIYETGDMKNRGSIGWAPFYCEGKFATIQCDFVCMVSPEDSRRFVIPCLAEEAAFLDHCVYHLDGPGALVHLDDILAIPDIDVIQWVPGAGNPGHVEWIDLLKRIQKAKKGLQINCSVEEVETLHRELRPEGVLYNVSARSRQAADELISWLKRHT